jgi:hypothetical protein
MAAVATRSGTRLDATGFAIAIVAHVALLYILTRPREGAPPDEPAAMEVSFVEEVGPVSSSPVTAPEPTPAFGDEMSPEPASGADASTPAPVTPPVPEPVRPPVETGERRRPDVTQNRVPVRPSPPPRVTERTPQRPVPSTPTRPNTRPGPRGPSFADVARNVGGGAPSARPGPAASAPAQLSTGQRQQIARNISGLIAPCAARAQPPNGFARGISVDLRVTVTREGVPTGHTMVGSSGVNGTNEDYVDDVTAVAMRAVRSCASRIATLPDEYYAAAGGWRTFRYRFRFP